MNIGSKITSFSLRRHRLLTWMIVAVTTVILLAAALPSLHLIDAMPGPVKAFSRAMGFLPEVAVDTDPENMLDHDEAVRVFNDEMKHRLRLYDMIVVGVVNDSDPAGVFNPGSLRKVFELTEFAKGLQFDQQNRPLADFAADAASATSSEEPAATQPAMPAGLSGEEPSLPSGLGLEAVDSDSPSLPAGLFDAENPATPTPATPATPAPPATPTPPAAATEQKLRGVIPGDVIAPSTVDSIEPSAGAIVFQWLMAEPPATQAEADEIRRKAQRVPFLNGTLVSDDGKALAIYLPISAKDLSYNVYQQLLARIDQFGDGPEQFHITGLPVAEDTFGVEMFIQMAISAPAAMVVIFLLMLIFFRKFIMVLSPMIVAMVSVIITMGTLIVAGFPIHIMSSMIPIFIMPIAVLDSIHIISEFFEKYQATRDRSKTMTAVMDELFMPMLYTSLTSTAGFASLALTPIPPVQVFGIFVAIGIMVAWVLTVTFVPAFVMFIPAKKLENFGSRHHHEDGDAGLIGRLLHWMGGFTYRRAKLIIFAALVVLGVAAYGISLININDNPVKWFRADHPIRVADRVLNDHFGGTYMAYLAMEAEGGGDADIAAAGMDIEIFKRPDVLRWQSGVQQALQQSGSVGKSNSLADIVKTVHRDLMAEGVDDPKIEEYYRIPDTQAGVAQMIIQFQSSHRPADLEHFAIVSGEGAYRTSSVWVQLTSGDNRDMEHVVNVLDEYIAQNPPPVPIRCSWFGLTYINVVWQDKMVSGMLEAFVGSFLVVFLLMVVLFRSALWGLLSMVPLTVTIAAIYGVIGLMGKDYDMPVAVLSSLTLGLAVDFAIHFLARAREVYAECGSWQQTTEKVFAEPARAIMRNIIVIAAGFLPLLAAPLVPYQTVGVLLATILLTSGLATLLLLPALIRLLGKWLFRSQDKVMAPACNCVLCLVVSATAAAIVALSLYSSTGWSRMTWIAIVAIPISAFICGLASRRARCRSMANRTEENKG